MRQYILLCPCVSSSVFRDTRQLSPDPASSLGQPWAELRRETRVQLRQSRDIRVITGAVTSPTLTSGASVTCTSVPVDGQCTLMSNDTSDDQPRDICTGLWSLWLGNVCVCENRRLELSLETCVTSRQDLSFKVSCWSFEFGVNSMSEQMKRILSCQFPYCCAIIHS